MVEICPAFSISAPSAFPARRESLTFRLISDKNLEDLDLKFNWSNSFGKIISGQGTKSITVKVDKKIGEVTVVVEITGLPENCHRTVSAFVNSDYPTIPLSVKVDEFGAITDTALGRKIKILSKKLKDNPPATVYLVKSFAKNIDRPKTYLYLQVLLEYLKLEGIDKERIAFATTQNTKDKIEFWIVLPGADLPKSDSKAEHLTVAELKRKVFEQSLKR